MADQQKNQILSADEVRKALGGSPSNQAMGYTAVTPVQDPAGTARQSSAWRNVQAAGAKPTDYYQQMLGAQPGSYSNPYGQQIQQSMNNLLNQQPFRYDVNQDALYQQIKDNYIRQGRQAMMDTQGASAALTGGYGNSYGAMAGQQAYQESLGALADRVPELYQLAYNQYLNREQSQRQNLDALQALDESQYQRYQYDTQQYEQKLADAYEKYKEATKSSGSGSRISYDKYKQYVEDAMAWADVTGGDVSEFVRQAVALGTMPQKVGDAVITATSTYQNYQDRQTQQAELEAAHDEIMSGSTDTVKKK